MSDKPKRLYEVEVEYVIYAVARSRREAERFIEAELRSGNLDEIDNPIVGACEVGANIRLPDGWATSCPYGEGGNEKTCQEWLDQWAEYERTRSLTHEELEAQGQRPLAL